MIGVNHQTSSIETREKAALGPGRLEEVLCRLVNDDNIEGATILSTCNRTEIYLSPFQHQSREQLGELLVGSTGLSTSEASKAYHYTDDDVVQHLCRVASGLNSLMLGEKQVLAQVKDAYRISLEQKSANKVLNKLFTKAIECGKDVHSHTEISHGAVSVASAAVQVAERIFGNMQGCRVLLVGAGETARLAAKHLVSAGVKEWRVCNRTEENAKVVADLLGGTAVAFPPTTESIAWADLIVSATSATEPVITGPVVREARKHSKSEQLILDLAVPRDIDPVVREVADVYLYTVDDFKELVASNLAARKLEAVRAEKIVQRYKAEFSEWYQENRVAPTIRQIQEVLEELRSAEVERNIRRFRETDQATLDLFSKALMRKVTSLMVANLKKASADENDLAMARAITLALANEKPEQTSEVLEQLDYELSH